MFDHKKITAFLAALLMGVSAVTASCPAVYAENETKLTAEDSGEDIAPVQETPKLTGVELKEADGFKYSVTSDGTACIQDCSLTDADLVIPDEIDGLKVTELGKRAFGSTEGLPFETITIPAGVEYISSDAPFIFCDKLKEIKVDAANKDYVSDDGILYSADKKTLLCYPQAKVNSSFTIPDGVEKLYTGALYNTSFSEITVPASLKEIGASAFNSISALSAIDLSETAVTDIDAMAFAECTSLKDIKFPKQLESIQGGAFWGCTSLSEIELPEGLLTIGQSAFIDTALKEVVIPKSVQTIAYCAFGYETSPSGEEIPLSNFSIIGEPNSAAQTYATDSDPEYGYKNDFDFKTLQQYELQKEIESYEHKTEGDYEIAVNGDEAYLVFCMSGDKEIKVPEKIAGYTLTLVYPAAFSNCNAEKIVLPDGVKTVRETAFFNCAYLKELVLPQSLEVVGANCFSNCAALEDADLGGAKIVGTDAFTGCSALRHVKISGNCTSLGEHLPFTTCTLLEDIEVSSGDGAFSSKDGILYDHDGKILIEYPLNHGDSTVHIPDGVKEIGAYSFAECKTIKDVVLPKSLESIGQFAFYNCDELKKLRVYKHVSEIGECAFGFKENPDYEVSQTGTNSSKENVEPHLRVDGFKLYTSKNSEAYDFAKKNDLEVVTGTVRIGDMNVSIPILVLICSGAGIVLLGILFSIIKASSKKKQSSGKKKKGTDKKNEA